MNPPNRHESVQSAAPAEDTLRLLAALPAPQGLEDRVKERLRNAPSSWRVLRWPDSRGGGGWMRSGVMRATAAAAIVFVVAGGGWGVYSHVLPVAQPKVIAMPAPINAAGGFKSAGAMRTPQTLQGPVLARPVVEMPKAKDGAANSHALPSRALPSRKPHRRRKTAGTSQSSGTSN